MEAKTQVQNASSANPLFPAGHSHRCPMGSGCPQAIALVGGRVFITFGHAGFNSPANNADGYATEAKARAIIRRYQAPDPNFQAAEEAREGLRSSGLTDKGIDSLLRQAWPDLTCLRCLARGSEPCLCPEAVA